MLWFTEHRGVLARTGHQISNPSFSAIHDHSLDLDHPFSIDNFNVLSRNNSPIDSKIKESLYIKTTKPILNNQTTSYSLNLHYELLRSHEHQYKSTYTRHPHLNVSSLPTTKTSNTWIFNLCLIYGFLYVTFNVLHVYVLLSKQIFLL